MSKSQKDCFRFACCFVLFFEFQGFIGSFRAEAKCDYWKVSPFSQKSFGRTFSPSDWKAKLDEVHDWLWTKWSFVKETNGFELPKDTTEQEPGCIKDEQLLADLQSVVESLPTKTKYPKVV